MAVKSLLKTLSMFIFLKNLLQCKLLCLCLSENHSSVSVIYTESYKDFRSFFACQKMGWQSLLFLSRHSQLTAFQELSAFESCSCASITRLDERPGALHINKLFFWNIQRDLFYRFQAWWSIVKRAGGFA